MGQQHPELNVTDMQTGGRRNEADLSLQGRAEAMADQLQEGYGKAKDRVADLAETATEEVADQSHRLRQRVEEFEPRAAGRAVLRQAKNAQWPLLLIGGALGFGLAAWMGANDAKAPPSQPRRRKS